MKARTRRAFSLVELLTVIGIIALLISILMPALGRAREIARRTVCIANLRAITQGCITYAVVNRGNFPCWGDPKKNMGAGFTAIGDAWDWDGVSAKTFDPKVSAPTSYSPISNTRNLWKLVQMQAADTKTWLCPSDGEADQPFTPAVLKSQDPAASSISDVQNRSQFSYAFQYQGPAIDPNPPTNGSTIRTGWNTNMRDDPKLVILADTSPAFKAKYVPALAATDDHTFEMANGGAVSPTFPNGKLYCDALSAMKVGVNITWDASRAQATVTPTNPKDMDVLNSPNHRGEGQNFLRLDGSGDFAADPWCGAFKDNIWTVQDIRAYNNPGSPPADDVALGYRVQGEYDSQTYSQTQLLKDWAYYPDSKTTYPDSFLVP